MDALDRVERELAKSALRGDIMFQHEDLEAICRELRAAREAVKIVAADVFEVPAREVKEFISKKMKEARGDVD